MKYQWLILKDEMSGFARSWVMLALWVGMPALAIFFYFITAGPQDGLMGAKTIPMVYLTGLMLAGIGGTLSSVMVAVDIVNEKNRKVYDIFVIRPIKPSYILWAKFGAVFFCVEMAFLLAMGTGLVVDLVRGQNLDSLLLEQTLKSVVNSTGVIALSAAVGVVIGVVSNSVLIAVILILYLGQNLPALASLPALVGLDDWIWASCGFAILLSFLVIYLAGLAFNKKEF